MTTFDPVTSTVALTLKPEKVTFVPSISTQPRLSQCHPGPLDTWPGTAFRTVPAGTPEFDSSGKPQALGSAAQFFPPLTAPPADVLADEDATGGGVLVDLVGVAAAEVVAGAEVLGALLVVDALVLGVDGVVLVWEGVALGGIV